MVRGLFTSSLKMTSHILQHLWDLILLSNFFQVNNSCFICLFKFVQTPEFGWLDIGFDNIYFFMVNIWEKHFTRETTRSIFCSRASGRKSIFSSWNQTVSDHYGSISQYQIFPPSTDHNFISLSVKTVNWVWDLPKSKRKLCVIYITYVLSSYSLPRCRRQSMFRQRLIRKI